ncbi:ferredoxin reductase domain-containing protein [Rhizorhabdus argentea]|uniref:oxidoreductase n=1 Tax=Rhizorhabdus argentea TaxID=1387174 RepID=UPI0030EEC304
MSGFNYIMLALAGIAILLFVIVLAILVPRTRGRGGFEPAEPRRAPQTPSPRPAAVLPITAPAPAVSRPDHPLYAPWRLIERNLANSGSAGGPLFRLRLVPEGVLPAWRAGAIARIYCGPAAEVLEQPASAAAPAGDYMVGSLPAENAVDLVVRLCPGSSPNEGRRSRWLCEDLQTGQQVALLLREEPDFLPPPDAVPLILIGNATGLAGLRAHIKSRPPGTRNWLIFGDRNSADDQVMAVEISDWVSSGHLGRCDLVFPGDGEEPRLVTDQLEDAKAPLLDWALAGSAIYVCGSRSMGDDVHAALTRLLGGEVLEVLAEAGLYRRLLY